MAKARGALTSLAQVAMARGALTSLAQVAKASLDKPGPGALTSLAQGRWGGGSGGGGPQRSASKSCQGGGGHWGPGPMRVRGPKGNWHVHQWAWSHASLAWERAYGYAQSMARPSGMLPERLATNRRCLIVANVLIALLAFSHANSRRGTCSDQV